MANIGIILSEEEERRILAKFPEPPRRKPKPEPKPTVTLEVEPATAERVRARPESVRLSTVREDAIPVLERVRPREIVQVLEVDAEGRPKLARHIDCATGDLGMVEYRNGYRQGPGVMSDYNPMDGLRRPEDE